MDKKFIAVLNESFEVNKLMIALGHIASGLAGMNNADNHMNFISYFDVDNSEFPNISQYPFIVLKGKHGRIKSFREELVIKNLPYSCFLDTMLSGGSKLQQKNTREKSLDEIKILAIVTFGDKDTLEPLTKKFSLWR